MTDGDWPQPMEQLYERHATTRDALDRLGQVFDIVGRTSDGEVIVVEAKAPTPKPKRTRARRT
jgi:hypothetical protein